MSGSTTFLEGPAGTGKTSFAIRHMLSLLADGAPAETILVLTPQRTLGRAYTLALHDAESPVGGDIVVVTLAGLARRNIERFWPLLAKPSGFAAADEPVFLTIETAQYYMMRFVRPRIEQGVFDAISLKPPRIAAQLLDNLAKAAVAGFPLENIADRLIGAWGSRQTSRRFVYNASQAIVQEFREFCYANNLLDYSLQLEIFMKHLLPHEVFQRYFTPRYSHIIADNIEEAGPVVHDFLRRWSDHWQTALYIYDSDGGYRTFLGADPNSAYNLRELCEVHHTFDRSYTKSTDLDALEQSVGEIINGQPLAELHGDPLAAFTVVKDHVYYPQMIDWVTRQVTALVEAGTPLGEIVILSPFLADSLRFSLQTRLADAGVPTVSHRPSRALREEPAARLLLTLLNLAYPQWGVPPPPRSDVAEMLARVIEGLDPIRAELLAGIVYKPQVGGELSSFERIEQSARERITYAAGGKYERLRQWLEDTRAVMDSEPWPLDYFLSRLFGEVLSQPGFGFHSNLDDGRVAAQVIESARKFRQMIVPPHRQSPDWNEVGREYLQLVHEGVLAGLYEPGWYDEGVDAVLLAPAYTFVMRNRPVDYQFWLDIGSQSWWERLDQPLTHPYVLTRDYPVGREWTEGDEDRAQRELLYRITVGLIRRCRKGIYLGVSDLGEQGYEQRGPMLYLFQQIMQRHGGDQAHG